MKDAENVSLEDHKAVSHANWLSTRKAFLIKEKEFTHLREDLSKERQELPWERADKSYVFDGPDGEESLAELFANCSQLAVYHFMFNPDWRDGCKHCSFWADNFNGIPVHLKHRDVSFVAISRGPFYQNRSFQEENGMELQVGVIVSQQFQL